MKFLPISSLLFASTSWAFSGRSGLCADDIDLMAENMGGENNEDLPFEIETDKTTYEPGDEIKVTVKATESVFRGLLLYARNSKNVQVGTWSDLPSGFQTLDEQCSEYGGDGATLSHSDSDEKETFELTWIAPSIAQGNLEFRGLIVGEEQTEWKRLNNIRINGPGSASETEDESPATRSYPVALVMLVFGVSAALISI